MIANLTRSFLVSLSACIMVSFFSCSKPGSPNGPGNITLPRVPQHLQPFTVQVAFRQSELAAISWTASGDFLGDTIFYKVLLQGKVIDSNLLSLADTLKNLSPNITYEGSVIAYTRYNDTVSAPFTLYASQGFVYSLSYDLHMRCISLFGDQVVWENPLGGYGTQGNWYGIPLVIGDTLFFNYTLWQTYALDTKTGQTIWQSPTYLQNLSMQGNPLTNGGPIYSNGNLYVTSDAGVACLNKASGQVIWSHQDGDSYLTTPVADNNKIFVGSSSTNYSTSGYYFTALDAATGLVIWKKPIGAQPTQYPIVCNGLLIFSDANANFYGVDQNTGSVIWTKSFSINYNNLVAWGAPVHYNNIVVGWANGKMYGLNTSSGNVVWQMTENDYVPMTAPAISHDTLFLTEATGSASNPVFTMMALRVTTGAILWQTSAPKGYVTSPIIAGDRLYVVGSPNSGMAVYSSVNGSYIGSTINALYGPIQVDGIVHYPSESGMVQ